VTGEQQFAAEFESHRPYLHAAAGGRPVAGRVIAGETAPDDTPQIAR
jgi:hypothetical protein